MTKRLRTPRDRNVTEGFLVTTTTVCSSGVRTSWTFRNDRRCRLFLSFFMRSMENATSSEVRGLPSWNRTPLRSLNSHSLPRYSQDSASRPTNLACW